MKKLLIISAILFSSCSTVKVNGVSIRKPHNKGLTNMEKACMIGGAVAGCVFVTHFNLPKTKQ